LIERCRPSRRATSYCPAGRGGGEQRKTPPKQTGRMRCAGFPALLSLVDDDAGAAETVSTGHSKENPATPRSAGGANGT
jgi:hypothetical protein